jgi:hypothetical protein
MYLHLEIIIASIFLYQLLGWSAFVGFLVLLAGWPLNSYVSKRAIRIQKGLSAARDKRMGVLNELIGAVRYHYLSLPFHLSKVQTKFELLYSDMFSLF